MPKNKLASMTIDDVLKELQEAKNKKQELDSDIVRLKKERTELQSEVDVLVDKKLTLKKDINSVEAKMDLLIKQKEEAANKIAVLADSEFSKAKVELANAERIRKDTEALQKHLKNGLASVDESRAVIDKILTDIEATTRELLERVKKQL